MYKVEFRQIELVKRFPLAISRGTVASSHNLFVTIRARDASKEDQVGLGELAPATGSTSSAEAGESQLQAFIEASRLFDACELPSPHDVEAAMRKADVSSPVRAALDVALWDLLAKQAGMPLYRLLGLPKKSAPTSVTIGLNPPDVTRERVQTILEETGAKFLKIKLGSPEGREHDKAHFAAAADSARPFGAALRVDANGGWTVDEARMMMAWLAERGVEYVEQPLAQGMEAELPKLFANRPLPIFLDESIRDASDVPPVADRCDGVNLKLMKSGGITEALRIAATARAHGLGTMIGCMSESSVAIAAGAAMGALFDYIDLDSHLNLAPDPATGAPIEDGVIVPTDRPGHGAQLLA